jgi:hypothetical protein
MIADVNQIVCMCSNGRERGESDGGIEWKIKNMGGGGNVSA